MSYRVTADNGVPREYLFYAQRFINADTRAEAEQAIQTLIAEGWKNIERDYPEEEEQMTERGVEYVVEVDPRGSLTGYRKTYDTVEEARQAAQSVKQTIMRNANRNVALYHYEQGKHTKLPIDEPTKDAVGDYVVTYTDTEGKSHSRVLKELSWAQGFHDGLAEAGAQPKIYKMVPLEES